MALVFPILSQFDDRAAKKADKTFGALGKKFAAVFSVATVVRFGKESVRAFQEAEKEAAQLRAQLEAVNLGFASDFVDDYIDNLALLSGIAGNQLNSAFITLSQATEDVTTAQKLLNASLDIAAGTSKDLRTVSVALQRAYQGEVTALARLKIGYTAAELKGRDFDDVLTELTEKFRGSASKAADTLAGKMARLAEATDQAKEAFGAGFITGLENSQVAIEDYQKTIIDLGDAFGQLSGQAIGFFTRTLNEITASVEQSDSVFSRLVKSLVKNQAEASRLEEERGRSALRQRNVIIRAEEKALKVRRESAKLAGAEKKNAEAIAKAKAMFDIEQIQIQAALQGKITEEERTRLLLMKAIIEENGGEAERLTAKLEKLQNDTQRLATALTTLKAGDPFEDWDTYFKEAGDMIAALFAKLQNLAVATDKMLTESRNVQATRQAAVITAKEERVIAYGEAARQTETMAQIAAEQAAVAIAEAIAAQAAATTAEEKAAADAFLEGAKAAQDAANVLAESVVAAFEAEALAALNLATELEFEAMTAVATSPQITVNVSGNVISEYDLAQTIINEQYQYQRSGGNLTYNTIAI